jgi:sigma-B regulation protein RsbU (phosphoserine phosphatase)
VQLEEGQAIKVLGLGLMVAVAFVLGAMVADLGPVYLVPILLCAHWFGRRPAIAAAAASAVLLTLDVVLFSEISATVLIASVPMFIVIGGIVGRLYEERRAQRRELIALRAVQDVLAPTGVPDLPLLEVATRYLPAERGVAGDFFLIAEGPNNSTVFVIGDVAGKGVNAARRAAFVRSVIAAAAPYSGDPVSLLTLANAELFRQYGPEAEFITMLCLVVSAGGKITWSRAGHPPPVRLADGAPIGTCAPAIPLGLAPDLPARRAETNMPEGGVLLYTDGLTDARPPGGSFEPYGTVRLARALAALGGPTAAQAVDHLVAAAHIFARGALPDDLCLLAFRSKLPHQAWLGENASHAREEQQPSFSSTLEARLA